MEDFEAQELEFWARLSEEGMSRSQMLRRSAAAAFGLTVLACAGVGTGVSSPVRRFDLAGQRSGLSMSELVSEAKKEGHINTIALPPDWANYGEIISTFQKKYGLSMTDANPNGTSAEENQAIVSLKGSSRAPDAVDVGPAFAIQGAAAGPLRPVQGLGVGEHSGQPA